MAKQQYNSEDAKRNADELKSWQREMDSLGSSMEANWRRAFELENRAQGMREAGFLSEAKKLEAQARGYQNAVEGYRELIDNEKTYGNQLTKQAQKHEANRKQLEASVEVAKQQAEVFKDIGKSLANIPGIGGLLSDVFSDAAKKVEQTGSKLQGLLSVFNSIAKVAGPTAIIKSMLDISNQTQDISRNLGIGFEAARDIRREFAQIAQDSNDVRINSIDLVKAQGQLQQSFGLSAKASGEVSTNFIRNSEYLGASVEAAGKLEKIIAINGVNSSEFAGNLALAANETSKTYGVNLPLAEVVEKISKLQGATLSYLKDSPKALAEAVAISTKLGIEFNKIRGIADGLVNFESSITAELEAEVFLGRDINLNKARQLAFMGDEVGLAKEIGNLVGTSADLNAMLPIQQQSYAKALGMSRDELADMVMQQELSNRFGEQAKDLSQEQLRAAKELADNKGISDGEALRRIQEEVSATKKFEDAAQKIRSAFQDALVSFAPILEGIASTIGTFAKDPWAKIITVGAAALGTASAAAKIVSSITGIQKVFVVNDSGGASGLLDGSIGGRKMSTISRASRMGKFGLSRTMGMKGVGIGAVGALAGSLISSNAEEAGMKSFGSALSAAGTGAMIGSVIPGVGTAAGAIIGAGYGAITGFLDAQEAKREAKREQIQKEIDQKGAVAEELRLLRAVMESKDTTIELEGSQVGKALNKGSAMYTTLYKL